MEKNSKSIPARYLADQLIDFACDHWNVKREDLVSRCRKQPLPMIRFSVMMLTHYNSTPISARVISDIFGLKVCSFFNGKKKYPDWLAKDVVFQQIHAPLQRETKRILELWGVRDSVDQQIDYYKHEISRMQAELDKLMLQKNAGTCSMCALTNKEFSRCIFIDCPNKKTSAA